VVAEKSNQAAINNFSQAKLEIVDDNLFSIISDNILQQKFIESERAGLIDHMQSFFNNKYLTFQLLMDEKEVVENTGPKPPTIREQYNQLAAQYPMIRELKERLKLELGS
jgi:DNA polymerase-3 subunit gamma/tau